MNQIKIGAFIKKLRKESNLTQEKFGEKYGVTYQAVSKWENGKNIPDIAVLNQICEDYHLNINVLLGNEPNKYSLKKVKLCISIASFLACLTLINIMLYHSFLNSANFSFETLNSSSAKFSVSGAIAYNKFKTSGNISNITYNEKFDNTFYKKIECELYANIDNTQTKIGNYSYQGNPILLNDYLKKVKFNFNSKDCKIYKNSTLFLVIIAVDSKDQSTFYKIPLENKVICDETDE